MPLIATDSLAKTYTGFRREPVHALRPLDLSVEEGEIFGLLGPNGAGKTTLVKLLLGIVHPTNGRAWLFEAPIQDAASRSRVGYLPENHRFPGFLTGRQALDYYGRMAAIDADQLGRQAEHWLERVGLTAWAGTPVGKYSKGMMQRLGLAQALLSAPRLLFLDEPTDGVDPVGRREIRDLLLELRGDGVTIFLNSHLLGEVEQVCTRVAILHEGRMVHEGSVAALTSRERTWELRCTSPPPDLIDRLGDRLHLVASVDGAAEQDEVSRFELRAEDRGDLNATLDQLRAAGVQIEALTPLRQSLEDAFVEVISNSAKANGS